MTSVYSLLKLNRLIRFYPLKALGVLLADLCNMRYTSVRVDPVLGCNLRCKMCYFGNEQTRTQLHGRFSPQQLDQLAAWFYPRALQVVFGCGAEPTLYKDLPKLIGRAKQYRVPVIGLTTNGQLLTPDTITRAVEAGLSECTVSLHGVTQKTYESFMPGASHTKLHEVLQCIARSCAGTATQLRFNYTCNPDNLHEAADIISEFGCYNPAVIQIRPIMDIGQTGYARRDLSAVAREYGEVLQQLEQQAHRQGITLLSTPIASEEKPDPSSQKMVALAHRYISPQRVWREEFDWHNESLQAFRRRIGWRKKVLMSVFGGALHPPAESTSLQYSVR
jgi:molybdenum cofactor biosynthesis enzyme MoaA